MFLCVLRFQLWTYSKNINKVHVQSCQTILKEKENQEILKVAREITLGEIWIGARFGEIYWQWDAFWFELLGNIWMDARVVEIFWLWVEFDFKLSGNICIRAKIV